MSLPALPTDNLYKFMAIAGVLSILVANYMTSRVQMETQEILWKERKDFREQLEAARWKMIDGVRKDHPEKAERTRELKSLEPLLDQQYASMAADYQGRVEEIGIEQRTLIRMLSKLETVGYFLSVFGFFAWWFLVQHHQDVLLRSDREKALKDNPLPPTFTNRVWARIRRLFASFPRAGRTGPPDGKPEKNNR